MNSQPFILLSVIVPMFLTAYSPRAAGQEIRITHRAVDDSRIIPVSMEGFTGEVKSVLTFDLEIAGFDIVGKEKAHFYVEGSNEGHVIGRVIHPATKETLISKGYQGGSVRSQAHALADDIVLELTGVKGIASTKIAFKVDTGRNSEIYVADYDGHNAVKVTSDQSIVAAPCWVPGERILYYTSYKDGNPDIFYHNLATGIRKPVARYSGLNTSVAVSPDGNRIAMILSKGGSPDLYVADAKGNNLKQLTHTREAESSPCWSPDGKTVCFVSRTSGRAGLYTVSAGGGPTRYVRTAGISNPTEPVWSPDGQTIAFTAMMGDFNICTVPAGGGVAEVLTGGEDPSWAPNSRTLIFTKRRQYERILSLLDVPTKREKNIHQLSGSSSQPSWAK